MRQLLALDLQTLEELAHSIVQACASPGVCDIASVRHNDISVSVWLAGERIDLEPGDPRLPLQIAYLKSRVASITRARRVNAMLDAVEISPNAVPLWTLSALRPIAEWVVWADVGKQLSRHARWAEKTRRSKRVVSDRVSAYAEIDGRLMALHAGLYGGVLTGSLVLSARPHCYFTDRPHSRIVVEQTTLPEHLTSEIELRSSSSNKAVRLSDIMSHPLFSVYDPPVAAAVNRDDAVEIAFDCDFTTLEPVPTEAMRMVPFGADPARPWDLTPAERARLREL